MDNIYLIAVNTSLPFNPTAFHNYITTVLYPNYIYAWWHHLPGGMYLVKSRLNVNQLYNATFPGVPGRHLVVIRVDPTQSQGWLPREAWNWINTP